MDPELRSLFRADVTLHPIERGLWSALAEGGTEERYDDIVASYDRVIGSRLYQRLAWGSEPGNDVRFARAAADSATGPLLDVGCGSLLFTADVHASSGRPSVLLDLSLGMLRRGAERLAALRPAAPDHLALVQADALDLPLRPGCARTVLCPGILHLFEEPEALLRSLASRLAPGGRLFLTSLVTDRRFGRAYLRLLARSGEVRSELTSSALKARVEEVTGLRVVCEAFGNMAYLRTEPAGASVAPIASARSPG